MMKAGIFTVFSIMLIVMMIPTAMASTAPCSDGTPYYACSTKSPGFRCMPNVATGTNSLQLAIGEVPQSVKCPCEAVSGYAEINGACVKSTCSVNGQTVQAGACKDYLKCSNGNMVEDPAVCGCPSGKKAQGGVCVENKGGCRWPNSVKCLTYQECKFDAISQVDDGTCMTKEGCQYSQYNGKACNYEIETCNQATGNCDRKPGACLTNSDCGSGKTCNLISKTCDLATGSTGASSAPLLGGNAATPPQEQTGSTGGAAGTLCCLPIALGAGGVGMAFTSRRRK